MTGLRRPIVSIVKCSEHDNYKIIKESVKKCLDFLGGIESIISSGDTVLLKPNIIAPKQYTTGATTNPNIVRAAAELSKEAGAAKVVIAEGSSVGCSTSEGFKVCGIDKIAEDLKCELVDFAKDNYQYIMNPMGKTFKRIRIPEVFIRANVVINLPVMKTHDALGVTLGLKNMKGVIHISDKKRFHKWGLAQAVVDLNHLVLPELTIMDGTIAMEGPGPASGDPVNLGIIMASTDTVACDAVAMDIMGFKLEEIDYVRMASEAGLGCADLDKIEIKGENLNDVRRPFKRAEVNREKLREMGIELVCCDACSGCSNALTHYLISSERKGKLEALRNSAIIYGQNAKLPGEVKKRVIRFGVCTRDLAGADSIYIPGCPPHNIDVDEKLGLK